MKEKTLRDEFAMAALTGILASGIPAKWGQSDAEVAVMAYAQADAMMAEREKKA